MLARPVRVPVNIKRRSVSAVRDFPKGCGIKVKPNPSPLELDSNAKEADADVTSEPSGSVKVSVEGPSDSNPNVVAENGLKSEALDRPEISQVEGVESNGHVEKDSNLADLENLQVESDKILAENGLILEALEGFQVEGVKINGHAEKDSGPVDSENLPAESEKMLAENGVKLEALSETGLDEVGRMNGHMEEEASTSKKCVTADLKEETCNSRRYPVIKRRKVSAVRNFPVGCGRVASNGSKKANLGVGSTASSDSKSYDDGKKSVASTAKVDINEVRMNGDVAREKTEDEMRNKDEKPVGEEVQEMDGEAILKSPEGKTSDGEKAKLVRSRVSPTEKLEGEVKRDQSKQFSVEVKEVIGKNTIKSPKGRNSDGDKELQMKQKEMENGSDGASSAAMDEVEINQIQGSKSPSARTTDAEKKKTTVSGVSSVKKLLEENKNVESKKNKVMVKEETAIKSSKVKSFEGEKKLIEKQEEAVEGSDTVSSLRIVKTEAKQNETKKIRQNIQESSSKVQIKSPLRSSSSECVSEDNIGKKKLVRSTPEKKLEGRGVKQPGNDVQVKESRETRAPSQVKKEEKIGKSLAGKLVEKRSIEDGKDLKRKVKEEEGDESLEDYADKLIVQALMSAQNCPWRKGRKSAAGTSRSTTPKSSAKKVKKVVTYNSASVSNRESPSLHKNIVDVEDEEDSQPQNSGSEMAVTLYNGLRELCITMPPCVPSGQVSKGSMSDEAVSRSLVKKTLRMFQLICRKLVQEEESSKGKHLRREEADTRDSGKSQRVDLKAAKILKESNQWVNHGEAIIGHVPGVEVGDEFHFRVELSIIGIHRPFQGGIDYTKRNGVQLATSIVSSGGYPDDIDSSDVLVYSGSGGNASGGGEKQAGDQKLERGNLALKNSIDAQTPVRVVYGSKELTKSESQDGRPKMVTTFTYDGLYLVEKYWPERGSNGFNVFKFQLRKMPGQPEISLKEVKKTKKSKVREGLCVKDISGGKEKLPICAVNTVDGDAPMPFKYITKVIYPSWYVQKPPRGCDCTDGCSDSDKCACAMKNGGEIPFNFNGAIVQAKPLVYECGPSCKCPPSCHNRVSQHGIRLPLEIFRTESRGWGVRSLYSIPSGTFVCEYIGEMLEDAEAEQRTNDEYLFDIGHNYDDHTLWEGLPGYIPGVQSDVAAETDSELKDVGFTIDAAEYGNVGRFINHSCSPNLYAQNLLYDHDDKKMPHVMFFAVDNIPPLQELTYHYNYTIDQVRDSEGNIKKKECLCGSPECTGRLY